MAKKTIVLENHTATYDYGVRLGRLLRAGDVVLLDGELGAGKTTLMQGIAAGAGSNAVVTSPSFALVNVYEAKFPLYHFDLYRLRDAAELEDIGFYELIENGGAAVVEWAANFPEQMPVAAIKIRITRQPGADGRLLEIEARDEITGD